MEVADRRKEFNQAIRALISKTCEDNYTFFTSLEYEFKIKAVKRAKCALITWEANDTLEHYRTLQKFDVMIMDGKERLIKPFYAETTEVLRYATSDELFDIIDKAHSVIGHGRKTLLNAELKKKYCNINMATIMAYLSLCPDCQKKSKSIVTPKPCVPATFNSHAQIDLMDMQSKSYSNFHFILVYHDLFTKFTLLKPLESKETDDITVHLLDIFTMFGTPVVLHSNSGKDFISSILREMRYLWPELKSVYGELKDTENEAYIVDTIRNIEQRLRVWMEKKKSRDWPAGIKFIQFQINQAVHPVTGKSPYEATFGCPPKVRLASSQNMDNNLSSKGGVQKKMQETRGVRKMMQETQIKDIKVKNVKKKGTNSGMSQIIKKEPAAHEEVWTEKMYVDNLLETVKMETIDGQIATRAGPQESAPLCMKCSLPLSSDNVCSNCEF